MPSKSPWPIHPAAELFPLLGGAELDELTADIRVHGLLEPVWLWNDPERGTVLLDGRNRMAACTLAGVAVSTRFYKGTEPLSFVISENVRRRHLTVGQLSAISAEAEPLFAAEAAKRQVEDGVAGAAYGVLGGRPKKGTQKPLGANLHQGDSHKKKRAPKAADQAAAVTGVSARSVAQYKQVKQAAPDLAEDVRKGKVTLHKAARQVARQQAVKKAAELPIGKYRVVYADPPWSYNDSSDGLEQRTGATAHYPSMTISELCALPVSEWCHDDAVLFLWITSPMLFDAHSVIKAWGFTYKASFIWDKVAHNMGHYNSVRHEFLLVCTRGSCLPDNPQLIDSVQSIERTEHSVKPEQFRTIIDTLYPHGERLEMFARAEVEGWDRFGNAV